MHALRIAALLALLVACGPATGGGDAGHHGTGACGDIIEACHEVDVGTGRIAECHGVAHDSVESACEPIRDECVALCETAANDGGPPTEDAGAPEDGGPPDLCDELGSLCHPYDTGAGPGHDCHELGHDGDLAACTAAEAMCRAVCSGDAGHASGEDAGGA